MTRLFLILVFLLLSNNTVFAQETYSLTINFIGMKSDKGAVFLGVHNKKEDFLKKRFKEAIIQITDKKATATFKKLPKGTYTVSAFHDENNNKKMDTNFLGIPKEPFGISNDAKGFMGAPIYKEATLIIKKNTQITITIN